MPALMPRAYYFAADIFHWLLSMPPFVDYFHCVISSSCFRCWYLFRHIIDTIYLFQMLLLLMPFHYAFRHFIFISLIICFFFHFIDHFYFSFSSALLMRHWCRWLLLPLLRFLSLMPYFSLIIAPFLHFSFRHYHFSADIDCCFRWHYCLLLSTLLIIIIIDIDADIFRCHYFMLITLFISPMPITPSSPASSMPFADYYRYTASSLDIYFSSMLAFFAFWFSSRCFHFIIAADITLADIDYDIFITLDDAATLMMPRWCAAAVISRRCRFAPYDASAADTLFIIDAHAATPFSRRADAAISSLIPLRWLIIADDNIADIYYADDIILLRHYVFFIFADAAAYFMLPLDAFAYFLLCRAAIDFFFSSFSSDVAFFLSAVVDAADIAIIFAIWYAVIYADAAVIYCFRCCHAVADTCHFDAFSPLFSIISADATRYTLFSLLPHCRFHFFFEIFFFLFLHYDVATLSPPSFYVIIHY